MPTYAANQVLGKTIFTTAKVEKLQVSTGQRFTPFSSVDAGQSIGICTAFVLPSQGYDAVYWQFGNYPFSFWVKHDSSKLRLGDGSLTVLEQKENARDWLDKIADNFAASGTIQATIIKLAVGAGLIYGGTQIAKTLITTKRK